MSEVVSQEFEKASIKELIEFKELADKVIEKKKAAALKEARKKMKELANEAGVSVEELVAGADEDESKKRKAVEPKYRNKSNPDQVWTGRGKQPRWLSTEIENGAKLEDFLIDFPESQPESQS